MANTVMIFSPHPDDAEYFAGGTLAKMIQEGAKVYIVIVTDGRVGSFDYDSVTLVSIRAEEARQAAHVLGAEPPIFLNHPDMGLDQLQPGLLQKQFIRLIRHHKPDIVIAEDAFTGYEVHPDHRSVAWAVSDAVNSAMFPLSHPEHLSEGLQTHFVKEKYYYTDQIETANKIVDITHTMSLKLAALSEHKSQMKFLVEDVLIQAQAAGIDAKAIAGDILRDPTAAIGWALQIQAAQVGQKINAKFGEAFRYVRFHPIVEGLMKS